MVVVVVWCGRGMVVLVVMEVVEVVVVVMLAGVQDDFCLRDRRQREREREREVGFLYDIPCSIEFYLQ